MDRATLEVALKQQVHHLAARVLEAKLNADHTDHRGATQPCPCGATARYVGRRAKGLTTVLGAITCERAYYHCAACGQGAAPRDAPCGLDASGLSPGVQRLAAMVGAMSSFPEGAILLQELAGIGVEAKAVERTAQRLGHAVAQDEATHVTTTAPPSSVMYVGVDGTGIPMRPEVVAGRPGKPPDGSAHTREVKECVVGTADQRDAAGRPVRDDGSVSHSAAIENAAWAPGHPDRTPALAQRGERELTRRGFFPARQQVLLGDGARWIWNLASLIAPAALQIVDGYHAKEHLSGLAATLFGPQTNAAHQWATARHAERDAGALDAVLAALRPFVTASGARGPRAATEYGYFHTNRDRMDYARFRALGLSVGSGVLEAGCSSANA